jgi:tetratricopeptide (TPR) repeat protein
MSRIPSMARPHLDRGLACVHRGDFSGAVGAFTTAIQCGADSAQVYFQRGAAFYNWHDDHRADDDFSTALMKDDRPAKYHLFRGLTRLRLQQFESALIDLTHAIDRDPESVEAAWARGRIFADRGDYRLAARDFGRVIALRPTESLAYSMRGEMHHRLRDWCRALADYRRALELSPDDPKCLNRVAWIRATCPDDQTRDGTEALHLAKRANQITNGSDPLILDTLAASWAECGQWADASTTIDQALRLLPDHADLLAHQAAYTAGQPWRE